MRCVEPDRNNRPTIAEVLDILNKTETHNAKRQMADVLPCPTIGLKSTESDLLEMMVAELDNITNKDEHCNSMPKDSSKRSVQQVPEIRETSSDVEEELIIGRTGEKQKILSILSASITEEMVILPIYGIGGIGKTTLAQLVFNDPQFQDYSRVWVYVTEPLDLKKIGNSIITQLTDENRNADDVQIIKRRLGKLSAGKRILIVLDDLWEKDRCNLDELKAMLRLGRGNKVIVVTTRDEDIAKKMCGPAVTPYKLDILTDDMCWTIIKQKTAFEDRVDKEQLEQIGRDIATKCGGVALAAQALGYMLWEMTSDRWESVRDSCIWNLSTRKDPSSRIHKVLASLLLSYSHMPDWLKLCFSYCAVFPKGRTIVKYDLFHQWIALGFTEKSDMFDPMQLCEAYITQLLGMSFLQYSRTQPSSDTRGGKDVTLFTMHDLVHDLAKEILAHQINAGGHKCRYALLTDCSKSLQLFVTFPAKIRALHFQECGKQELCGGAFSPAKCLCVLDLSECFIPKLPDCIGQLKQLRFLHAPRIKDRMIPNFITELSELNYLNLRGSKNISALPESIGEIKALMHLDLSGCSEIHELPVSFMELKQLVHLDLSFCNISTSEAFGGFTKLQYLNLAGQTIIDADRRGLTEDIGNLIKLRYLNLSGCISSKVTSNQIDSLISSISTLSSLEHLDLSITFKLSSIPESIGNLRKLHTLDITGCYGLRKLPDSMDQMVSLKVLNSELVRLDELTVSQLNCASLPHFEVHASGDKCGSNIVLLWPTNPDRLKIKRLENVKSGEEAHSINLIEKQKIKTLTFEWTVAAGRFVDDREVLEKLVPPSSVERLTILGYRSVSLPGWFMDIRQYLPYLSEIVLCDFPKCNKLPPLELPNLVELNLRRMDGLEEWNTTHYSGKEGSNEVMFPKLQRLRIQQCAKLRIKPCLPRALYLYLSGCDNVLSSWRESSSHSGTSSSSPLTEMIVVDSKVPIHQWRLLHHLPALRKLVIIDCSDLSSSPQIGHSLSSLRTLHLKLLSQAELPRWLVQLTTLQELTLSGCASMTLPQWLGELTSLKKLEIEYCEGIRSLPDNIQQLTKLEHLTLRDCPALEKWCESTENKRKLAHITEIIPRSLEINKLDNKYKKPVIRPVPVIIVETIGLTNMKDTVTDEMHPDLYSAVMNMPGFTEEALLVALSHLMDNNAQASTYMGMHEEDQVLWLINFLKKQY